MIKTEVFFYKLSMTSCLNNFQIRYFYIEDNHVIQIDDSFYFDPSSLIFNVTIEFIQF